MNKVHVKRIKKYKVQPLEGKNPNPVLLNGCRALESANISYWLSAGTLLALHRDHDFIPHDTDIDVGVFGNTDPIVVISAMSGIKYDLIREVTYDNKPMQLAFMEPQQNIIYDIYFYHEEGDHLINHSKFGKMEKPLALFRPLGEMKFRENIYSAPNNIEAYLRIRYGHDWNMPKKKTKAWSALAANIKK
ncbi:MAG: LicD family protein [Candidatus Marinimicrobia bacterium]|nr:LicD family protein [Candidatus Neomarinimicrobiota bacterium]